MPQEKALLPIQVHKKKNSIEDINIFDESLTILRASIIIRWRKRMAQAFFGRVFIGFNFLCLGTVRNIILSHYSPSLKNQLGKWIRSYLWKAFLGRAQRDTLAYYPKKTTSNQRSKSPRLMAPQILRCSCRDYDILIWQKFKALLGRSVMGKHSGVAPRV